MSISTTPGDDNPRRWLNATLAADVVLFAPGHVLLITRKNAPYQGMWALPGGFVEPVETPQQAAARELYEETGIQLAPSLLREVMWAAAPYRDPRQHKNPLQRVVSAVYTAEVDYMLDVRAGDDASTATWVPTDQALRGQVAFDHGMVLRRAYEMVYGGQREVLLAPGALLEAAKQVAICAGLSHESCSAGLQARYLGEATQVVTTYLESL